MTDLAAEIAAIFEARDAELRAQAIGQARLQRITFNRQISDGQFQFEAVIDESADATEIFGMVQRAQQAADQLLAKAIIADRYDRIDKKINEIEMARKKLAEDEIAIGAENSAASLGRRVAIAMTSQQEATLRNQRDSIKAEFEVIQKHLREIEEAKLVAAGADWADVRSERTAQRLADLPGSRAAAA